MFKLVALAFLCLSALACSGTDFEIPKNSNSVDAAGIMADKNLSPPEKAEQLAKAAEQLVTVQGFAYASNIADLALQQDPSNLRAKFIRAVLAPIMVGKGILARVEPLAGRDPKLQEEYDKILADLETKAPNSTYKSFLMDGQPDIRSENDIQNYYNSISQAFGVLRQFAKENKDSHLTVMTSDTFFEIMKRRLEDACEIVETAPWKYEYKCPSPVKMLEVDFSRADFEGVQQIAAGFELYYAFYNSYDLSGAIQVAIDQKGRENVPAQETIDALLKDPKFATLRDGNAFKKIKEMGVDAVVGMRWVLSNQDSLCPRGTSNPRNRLGSLFNFGICVSNPTDAAQTVRKVASALAGRDIPVEFQNKYAQKYATVLNPASLMNSPIADLRSLTPLKFNKCNLLEGVGDPSVGGLLPKGDANTALVHLNTCYQ